MMTAEMTDSASQIAQQDQSAVAAVRGGDAERYRELVERHERRVYAVAWSRLGDAALAEEVTQEAFIRAYRRLWLLGDGAKFSGWIATIARRVAINFGLRHRRELNKRERWALENFSEAAPEHSSTENEPLHTPETLRQTLAELPAAHRECLVLFYLEGKSGAEAAAALGISEAALRVRLHRARAVLRERLEEKLEGSLEKLRPAKTLVPAIMAGVLASSTAKAATAGGAGTVITGLLAKMGFSKWLLPFGSFFGFLFLLPAILMSWLMVRLELKNFRDQEGFRARLFRSNIKDRILLLVMCIVVGVVIIPLMARLVDHGLFSGTKPETTFLLIAGFVLLFLPFSLRQLAINRNRFFMASIGSSLTIGSACVLAGLNLLPPNGVNLFIIGQALIVLPFYGQRPIRMDYNLFLRAAENLFPAAELSFSKASRSKAELLAFARFLGTRWLANNFRWSDAGLMLRLPPANFSQWTGWTDMTFNWSFRKRSWICLGRDGRVTAQLGEKDRRVITKLRQGGAISHVEWETQVSAAVSTAWRKFEANDIAAAEKVLGQVAESEVFVVSPAKGGVAKVRWLMAILLGVFLLVSLGINLPGCHARIGNIISQRSHHLDRAMADLNKAKTEEQRFYALGNAAKESFAAGNIRDAQKFAEELQALTPKFTNDWNYGNAVQDANLVLGRIAVRNGKIEEARKCLLASSASTGSPQMNSFGPNMSLALDLLEKGERAVVLEHFDHCRKFWKLDHGKLLQWTADVQRGRTPDFGANLIY
jgi:RNA polymerase sigma factor (sigma-70 family)